MTDTTEAKKNHSAAEGIARHCNHLSGWAVLPLQLPAVVCLTGTVASTTFLASTVSGRAGTFSAAFGGFGNHRNFYGKNEFSFQTFHMELKNEISFQILARTFSHFPFAPNILEAVSYDYNFETIYYQRLAEGL